MTSAIDLADAADYGPGGPAAQEHVFAKILEQAPLKALAAPRHGSWHYVDFGPSGVTVMQSL